MIKGTAIVLTNGWLDDIHAKTTHGLIRGSDRFDILAVIDRNFAGKDAGEILDNTPRDIPVYSTIPAALQSLAQKPEYCIVGVAVHGGKLPASMREEVRDAMHHGMSIVCGLHSYLSDDPEFRQISEDTGTSIYDIRKPTPISDLQFWEGDIYQVKAPRIAVLGTDCALGKRTTCRFLLNLCNENGIKSEMIYTGQTGWMEGYKYGFIFDATVNDFIGGEIERVIVQCDRETSPDLILIEGQSSLRNPGGPCGSEFLISGDTKGVILQHAPGRKHFDGMEGKQEGIIPSLASEIELIRIYGSKTLAITLSEEGLSDAEMDAVKQELQQEFGIPVIRPLKDGVTELLPAIRAYISEAR